MNHYKILPLFILGLIVFAPQTQAAMTYGATTATSDGNYTLDGVVGSVYSFGPSATTGSFALGAGLTSGAITIGGTATAGTITLGQATDSNTINIGNANTATTKTQTINIGSGTPAGTGKAVITIGNTGGATAININAGTGNVNVTGKSLINGSSLASLGAKAVSATSGTGTISSATTTVTGTGTAFSTEVDIGDVILGNSKSRVVTSIASNTSMEITGGGIDTDAANYAGDTFTIQKPILRAQTSSGTNALVISADGIVNLPTQVAIGTYEHNEDKLRVTKSDESWWAAIRAERLVTQDNPSTKNINGIRSDTKLTSTAGAYTGQLNGATINATYNGSGTSSQTHLFGVQVAFNNAGSTTLTNASGFYAALSNGASATVTNSYGFRNYVANAGTMTNYYGFFSQNKVAAATNWYHFYGGTGGYSYFGHSVGVGSGQTTPTALLHLAAGTATASTAPLKFTAGTNLTVAEAGAMEYDGTNLFYTDGSANRQTVESHRYAVAATANNLAYTLAVALSALTDGSIVYFKMPAANSGGAATLNVNSLGAKKMLKGSDNATQINNNDLIANGSYSAIYNSSLDSAAGAWIILNK